MTVGFERMLDIGPDGILPPTGSMHSVTHRLDLSGPPQRAHLRIENAMMGRFRLCRVSSTGHSVDLTETDHLTFLLPKKGALEVKVGNREFSANAIKSSLLFSPNSRSTRAIPNNAGRFEALALMVPMASIKDMNIGSILVRQADGFDQSFPDLHRTPSAQALVEYLIYLERELNRFRSPLHNARVLQTASAFASDLFHSVISEASLSNQDDLKHPEGSEQLVVKAETIFAERFHEPLSIGEVAEVLGIGIRTLQNAFRSWRGQTPYERLTHFRMEEARSRLSDHHNHSTVAAIALDCGFTHLGRFAKAYYDTYGEKPSMTRRVKQV